jgi:hypothetical protein
MSDEQRQFLTLVGQPPGRLTATQTCCLLNCRLHDLPVLIAARLLKPLGDPAPNGTKWFATAEITDLLRDRAWLSRMTSTLQKYWQRKNQRQGFNRFNPRTELAVCSAKPLSASPDSNPSVRSMRRTG